MNFEAKIDIINVMVKGEISIKEKEKTLTFNDIRGSTFNTKLLTSCYNSPVNLAYKETVMTVDVERLMQFFFYSQFEHGWASNAEKKGLIAIPGNIELPGYKVIRYEEKPLLVVDTYVANNETGCSSGHLVIFQSGQPVWEMLYGGQYEPGAIPTLKYALREAYYAKEFHGGRGLPEYEQWHFRYINVPVENNFVSFQGTEHIVDIDDNDRIVGTHWYRGRLMV